jgi:hypothetical protein
MLAKILDAPAKVTDGDIAVVRLKSDGLGPLESGILGQIRTKFTMCQLPGSSNEVAAYRLTSSSQCDASAEIGEQPSDLPAAPE